MNGLTTLQRVKDEDAYHRLHEIRLSIEKNGQKLDELTNWIIRLRNQRDWPTIWMFGILLLTGAILWRVW